MMRLLLHSNDTKLQPLLAPALSPYCKVIVEKQANTVREMLLNGAADVLILDLDSTVNQLDDSVAAYGELHECGVPVIVMLDDARRLFATELLERGAFNCIRKPPSMVELKVVVQRAYEYHLMKQELASFRNPMPMQVRESPRAEPSPMFGQMVGASDASKKVYDLVRRVTGLNAHILITGESGTGKELVARAIHTLSNRAMQPFVAVSCGAIPETLIEAELFGHEKGAYTGSTGAAAGYLERAGEGTLFLDEIGELSLQTQVKLLRVLQQREFTRLGSTRPLPLKARVLFATHRNLEEMVEAGTFRQDLYFRVNVFQINVPALRDRADDIPELVHHFMRRYSAMYEKQVTGIASSAMEILADYDWPGNIRELENVIQSAVILTDGNTITAATLPPQFQAAEEDEEPADAPDSFGDQLRHYKVKLAQKTIVECKGNKSLAARKLRVSRAYLHRLVRMPARAGAA